MTKDDYLRIAREFGMTTGLQMYDSTIVKLCSTIAALEREECAEIIERQDVDPAFKLRMASAIRNKEK
jgi:hypothetical protein